jgi:hypothetical protein
MKNLSPKHRKILMWIGIAPGASLLSENTYHSNSCGEDSQIRHHYPTHTSPDSIIMHRFSEMAPEIGVKFAG